MHLCHMLRYCLGFNTLLPLIIDKGFIADIRMKADFHNFV